jgi:hypothetical protein
MRHHAWGVAVVFLSVTTACGALVVVDGTGGEGGAGGAGPGSGSSSVATTVTTVVSSTSFVSSTTAIAVSTSGTGQPGSCGELPSFEACDQCCQEENPGGYDALITSYILSCACAPGSPCNAACDTLDPSTDVCPEPGTIDVSAFNEDCVNCFNNVTGDEDCIQSTLAECSADPACIGYTTCQQNCPF